ncbi:hypothetical protein JCM11641_003372 [Rhodosporidiobolus odoratus]
MSFSSPIILYDHFLQAVRALLNADSSTGAVPPPLLNVTAERWETLPAWLHRVVIHMLKRAASTKLEPKKYHKWLVGPLLAQVAWCERQMSAINEYTRFHSWASSRSTLFRLVPDPDLLYRTRAAETLPPAFPLLPFSQQYTSRAYRQAIEALSILLNQCDGHSTPLNARLRQKGEERANRWLALQDDERRTLSRNIWNAFVLTLGLGITQPLVGAAVPLDTMFFHAPPDFLTSTLNPELQANLATGTTLPQTVDILLHRAQATQTISPEDALDLVSGLMWMLDKMGGWAQLGLEDRRALGREFEAIWAQMEKWKPLFPLSEFCGQSKRNSRKSLQNYSTASSSASHLHQQNPGVMLETIKEYPSLGGVRKRFGRGRAGALAEY